MNLKWCENLSILMWLKVHYNQNNSIVLKFTHVTVFDQNICFKIFWIVKIIKSPSDFEHMTHRLVIHALPIALLTVNEFKKNIFLILLFIISVGSTQQYECTTLMQCYVKS